MRRFRVGERVKLQDGRTGRVAAFRPFQGRLLGSGFREPGGEMLAIELDGRQGIRYRRALDVERLDEAVEPEGPEEIVS